VVPFQQMVRLDSKANRFVLGIEDIALAYGIHLQHDKISQHQAPLRSRHKPDRVSKPGPARHSPTQGWSKSNTRASHLLAIPLGTNP
jgi:hypothetical protein